MIILGITVVITGIILLFLKYFPKTGEVTDEKNNISTSRGLLTEWSGNNISGNEDVGDMLTEKSVNLIIALSKKDGIQTEDPMFMNLKKDFTNELKNDLSNLDSRISIRIDKNIVNSDKMSGQIYITVKDGVQKYIKITLTYAKDFENNWKLVGYSRFSPVVSENNANS